MNTYDLFFEAYRAFLWSLSFTIPAQYYIEKKLSVRKFILFTSVICVLIFLGYLLSQPLQFILFMIGLFITIKIFYRFTINKSFKHLIIIILANSIGEAIIYSLYVISHKNFPELVMYSKIHVLILYSFICVSSLAILCFIKRLENNIKIKKIFKKIKNQNTKTILFTIYVITILFIMGMLLKFLDLLIDTSPIYSIFLYFLTIILLPLSLFLGMYLSKIITTQKLKLSFKQKEFEQLKFYTDVIENISTDLRKQKHDYTNTLFAIRGYIDQNDMNGLKDYYFNQILISELNNYSYHFYYLRLSNIPDLGLKSLIAAKLNKANDLEIQIELEIIGQIANHDIDALNLYKIVGILLDNAIEAAVDALNKIISIVIVDDKNSTTIIIENSYNEKPNINKIFVEQYSTKGDHRGLGLSNLKEIIAHYPNIYLSTYFQDEFFVQEVEISYAIKRKETTDKSGT